MKSNIYTKEKYVVNIEMSAEELLTIANMLSSLDVPDSIKNDKTWRSFSSLFSEEIVVYRTPS